MWQTTSNLQVIPGIGPNLAHDLRDLGFSDPSELRGRDPERMFTDLCQLRGRPVDRCVLYAFRCAVYFVSNESHDAELLKWWKWKDGEVGRSPVTNAFACRLDALSVAERSRRANLFAEIHAAISGIEELANGYRVALRNSSSPEEKLDELVTLERRCCPFITFEVSTTENRVFLTMTGPGGIKPFLQSEFGL